MKVWTFCKNMYGRRPLTCLIFGHDMVDWNGHARCQWCEMGDAVHAKSEGGEK